MPIPMDSRHARTTSGRSLQATADVPVPAAGSSLTPKRGRSRRSTAAARPSTAAPLRRRARARVPGRGRRPSRRPCRPWPRRRPGDADGRRRRGPPTAPARPPCRRPRRTRARPRPGGERGRGHGHRGHPEAHQRLAARGPALFLDAAAHPQQAVGPGRRTQRHQQPAGRSRTVHAHLPARRRQSPDAMPRQRSAHAGARRYTGSAGGAR